MILIFGGAYQGKLDYAKANFNLNKICDLSEAAEPDISADCFCNTESYVMNCVKKGVEAKTWFEENEELLRDRIIIVTDVSQGVVPIDKDVRAFREMNGRLMVYLAGKADRVIRVFCGIGKDIK
ncbi:MAG: bifunctional adenosylcobinamide kinase/adenosylcobinamide-phosphate guanylyltransferase [Clostridia bacterium]|nr:bifunctional adenosylcobinamide kinase/adenosylcobinamide-phosphate guanylyltransferase [Clostridia bacterium]